MQLYTDSDGPTLDVGVRKRLERLDRNLAVTFSQLDVDPFTSRPLWTKRGYIPNPKFRLWSKGGDGRWRLVKEYERFGHREVLALERDVARRFSAREIHRRTMEARERRQERAKAAAKDEQLQVYRENQKRIGDLVFDGKSGMRERKIVAYAGQKNHSTPTERFLPDPREDGWVLPDQRSTT